ncbi:barstar family protein [Komagataeibacter sp. AV436]|uniref:Barstar family protein n=1 Tax=Komagataeibacter melomenusus TaxID=2766578 RepID=A0ABX2AK96_9PROT|nr:barstar family protein [Komagataeibacter melomenusus]MBV1832055.1 barstar family protein [Komagataeibacter melomenusus]NPC67851.1 barstar family protein [Komagataeibacter melomenusus]
MSKMFKGDVLNNIDGPWLFKTDHQADVYNSYDPVILSGSLMQTLDAFYDEIYKKFHAPSYAGKNFNALWDILTDLSWLINRSRYIVFFQNAEVILIKEQEKALQGFLEILEAVGREWSQPVQQSEWWDRPAMPFHSILQVKALSASCFPRAVPVIGAV